MHGIIYIQIYLSIYQSSYLSINQSIYLSVCLSVYLSICLSVYLSICLSVYLFVCLSVCLSVYLSICLSICLSVCLSRDVFPAGIMGPFFRGVLKCDPVKVGAAPLGRWWGKEHGKNGGLPQSYGMLWPESKGK